MRRFMKKPKKWWKIAKWGFLMEKYPWSFYKITSLKENLIILGKNYASM